MPVISNLPSGDISKNSLLGINSDQATPLDVLFKQYLENETNGLSALKNEILELQESIKAICFIFQILFEQHI